MYLLRSLLNLLTYLLYLPDYLLVTFLLTYFRTYFTYLLTHLLTVARPVVSVERRQPTPAGVLLCGSHGYPEYSRANSYPWSPFTPRRAHTGPGPHTVGRERPPGYVRAAGGAGGGVQMRC